MINTLRLVHFTPCNDFPSGDWEVIDCGFLVSSSGMKTPWLLSRLPSVPVKYLNVEKHYRQNL